MRKMPSSLFLRNIFRYVWTALPWKLLIRRRGAVWILLWKRPCPPCLPIPCTLPHPSLICLNKKTTEIRKALEYELQDKALSDRYKIETAMASGVAREDAIAEYDNDENLEQYYETLINEVNYLLSDD